MATFCRYWAVHCNCVFACSFILLTMASKPNKISKNRNARYANLHFIILLTQFDIVNQLTPECYENTITRDKSSHCIAKLGEMLLHLIYKSLHYTIRVIFICRNSSIPASVLYRHDAASVCRSVTRRSDIAEVLRLLVEILKLQIIPFEKYCNR